MVLPTGSFKRRLNPEFTKKHPKVHLEIDTDLIANWAPNTTISEKTAKDLCMKHLDRDTRIHADIEYLVLLVCMESILQRVNHGCGTTFNEPIVFHVM